MQLRRHPERKNLNNNVNNVSNAKRMEINIERIGLYDGIYFYTWML